MKEITIDCAGIETPRQLHQLLAQNLSFPQWYGSNLDALYDCLMSIREDLRLNLMHFDTLESFRIGFRCVLEDAENENPHLIVMIR